jgi:hypothetical protein
MLKFFAVGLLACLALNKSDSQVIKGEQIPSIPASKVDSLFPEASTQDWQISNDEMLRRIYTVSFLDKKKRTWITFNHEYQFIQIERQIEYEDLPQGLVDRLEDRFSRLKYGDGRVIITGDSVSYFFVHMDGSVKSHAYFFSSGGELIMNATLKIVSPLKSLFDVYGRLPVKYLSFYADNAFSKSRFQESLFNKSLKE